MRLAKVDRDKKTITIYENKVVLAIFTLESGDSGISPAFIEELRTAEYKEEA